MQQEKRKGGPAVPGNLGDILDPVQMMALRQMENFGWYVCFVRRPLFQEPVVVICNDAGDRYGVLRSDGHVDMAADFELRKSDIGVASASG